MSFFFSDVKSPKIKNDEIAKEHGCSVCPLNKLENKTPNMQPTGSEKPIIYFIGEAPGKIEDIEGEQLWAQQGEC